MTYRYLMIAFGLLLAATAASPAWASPFHPCRHAVAQARFEVSVKYIVIGLCLFCLWLGLRWLRAPRIQRAESTATIWEAS